jgi:hypothetical protein
MRGFCGPLPDFSCEPSPWFGFYLSLNAPAYMRSHSQNWHSIDSGMGWASPANNSKPKLEQPRDCSLGS